MAKKKSAKPYQSCTMFRDGNCYLWGALTGVKKPAKPKYREATPQDIADGFAHYAKNIKKIGNRFACSQDDPEFTRWYITYQQFIEGQLEFVREHFPEAPKLDNLPAPKDNVLLGMFALAGYCKTCAETLTAKPDEKVKESEQAGKLLSGNAEIEEQSLPLGWQQWANIFDMSRQALREIRDADNPKYHFRKTRKGGRKWTLPKSELPVEYLEKYRKPTPRTYPVSD